MLPPLKGIDADTPFRRLRQFVPKRVARRRCELCGSDIPKQHQHLFEPEARKLLCTCGACSLLFTEEAGTKLRRVPTRARFLSDFKLSEAQWNDLMIPIELVFFFYSSPETRIVALYPGPAGATESLLSLNLWSEIAGENAALGEMKPDVEALVVNRVGADRGVPSKYFIAPIDECYRLAGLIRMHWRGLSGGTDVWRHIADFFEELKGKSEISAIEGVHA